MKGMVIAGILAGAAHAQYFDPYEADEWTLHLWHLDEEGPPFHDEVPFEGTKLLGLLNHASAGEESLPGLGNSVSTSGAAGGERGSEFLRGGILLAAAELADGVEDDVPVNFGIVGEDGAFTYEAVIRLDALPGDTGQWAMSLISMDNEDSGTRLFNFRIESSGLLVFIPLEPEVGGAALAAIPTEGPHAINTADWFHVAVAYDGLEGVPENIRLYWTRLDAQRGEAHQIGSGTLMADMIPASADFAIGNEARTVEGNREAEPLVGQIDEVRISSVARDPTDYLFVPPRFRRNPSMSGHLLPPDGPLVVEIEGMWLDGEPIEFRGRDRLVMPPGLHRVDFDFGVSDGYARVPVRTRYRLQGLEDRWFEGSSGMMMRWEILDAEGRELSLLQFPFEGRSVGWRTGIEDSDFGYRREPIHLPEKARRLRISLSSEAVGTTGTLVVDNIGLMWGGVSLGWWANSGFEEGTEVGSPAGVPAGWTRGGSAPAIARMLPRGEGAALALIDGDQAAAGIWTCEQVLPSVPAGGLTLVAEWEELFRIQGGNSNRASFLNVPAGDYVFEVAASTTGQQGLAARAGIAFEVRSRFNERPSFWAVMAALLVASISLGIFADLRRRQMRKLAALRVQNALAEDRARIARDMHDDLGTRITRLTMNVALAERDLGRDPDAARKRLGNLSAMTRDLVTSMDGLVWSIDPANDSLGKFADRLSSLGDEVLEGSGIRCLKDFPPELPDWPMREAGRHHLFLATKEALHNALKHASPETVRLSLSLGDGQLTVAVEDNGRGFDPQDAASGNGLGNLTDRLERLEGSCEIDSRPGQGTRVSFTCPLTVLRRDPKQVP